MPRFPDVMVLAAGLGTRMLPLTAERPKPLLAVAGMPLIDRAVAAARAEGARRFVVNLHHRAAQLAAHLAARETALAGTRFQLSPEPELLGTGGGVAQALPLLETDPFLIMNADSFWVAGDDRPLHRMLAAFAAEAADLVLLCVHPRDAVGFRRSHDFCLDPRGRITRDSGAPVIYGGAALAGRELFAGRAGPFSFYDLIETSMDTGRALGVVLGTKWLHAGDPAALEDCARALHA